MKTPLVVLVLVSALGLLLGTAGCNSQSYRAHGRPTVALAITVNGAPPTPQQFDAARRKMLPQIESYGWVLLDNPEAAERIIRVDFVPDPFDPQNNGQIYVLGTYPNPLLRRTTVASTTYYSTPYEFRDYYFYPGIVGYWGYYGYYHHHDGHWGAPSGSSSGGPSTTPTPPPNQTVSTPPPPPSSGRYSPPDDQPVRRGKYLPHEPVRRIDPPSSSSGYSSYSGGSSSNYSGGSSSNYSGGSSSSYSGGSSSNYSGGSTSSSSWAPSAPASSDSSSSSARNGGERVEKER